MRDDCYTVRCLKSVLQTEVLRDVVRDNILFSLVWNLVLIMVIVRDNVLFLQVWSLVLIMVIQTGFFGGCVFGLYWVALVWSVVTSLFFFPSLPDWFDGGEVCRVCSAHIINLFVLWVT